MFETAPILCEVGSVVEDEVEIGETIILLSNGALRREQCPTQVKNAIICVRDHVTCIISLPFFESVIFFIIDVFPVLTS